MFETVAPAAFQTRSRRVFFETLPISIAVHVIGVSALVANVLWNVAFPTQSPKMFVAYNLTQVPDPPPPPPPLARPAPVNPEPPSPPPTPPAQVVAPTIIPDKIPDVVPPEPDPPAPPVAAPVAAPTAPVSSEKGVVAGQPGGSSHPLATVGGITFGDDGRMYVDRKVKMPLQEIDHNYPHYPDGARKKKLEGTCVVRYTIGKNGRVIDIAILDHAKDPMFDEETLNTVRSWRYRPMMVDGKPVEVVHELEVNYEFIVR